MNEAPEVERLKLSLQSLLRKLGTWVDSEAY